MLIHSLRKGGAERVLLEISLGLQYLNHQIEIVSWLDVDEYSDNEYRTMKRTFLLDKNKYKWPSSIPTSAKKLRKILIQFKPDIIEFHTPTVAWLFAATGIKIPCLHVLHGYGLITSKNGLKNKFIRTLNRFIAEKIRASYIVVSEAMVPAATKYFKIKEENISVITNGLDLNKFKYVQMGLKNREKIIISMIGTLCANKGQVHGINAFVLLLKSLPDATLQIVGEGPDNEKLKELVNLKKLNNRIVFLGRQNNINQVLANTHILWQLSESEAMPLVVLEAMATGVPVIGFEVRGTRDVVLEGKTGILTAYGDIEAIVKNTKDLLNDNIKYQLFTNNARHRIVQHFNSKRMVNMHERILLAKAINQI